MSVAVGGKIMKSLPRPFTHPSRLLLQWDSGSSAVKGLYAALSQGLPVRSAEKLASARLKRLLC